MNREGHSPNAALWFARFVTDPLTDSGPQAEDSVLLLQPDRALCSHLLDGAARLHAAAGFGGEAHPG